MTRQDRIWMKAMELGAKFGCHQIPERSFFLCGYQFPVCARCTGVILSAVFALFLFRKKIFSLPVCFALASVMLFDWSMQYLRIKASTNPRRFVTGFLGGLGVAITQYRFYAFLFRKAESFLHSIKNAV